MNVKTDQGNLKTMGVVPEDATENCVEVRQKDACAILSKWPNPMNSKALIEIVGEIVEVVSLHTEADQAALISQFLVYLGNVIGRYPFFQVEASKHHTNLFTVIVGNSSKARKGTSENRIRELFKGVGNDWLKNNVKSGLTSGVGLKYHVRNARLEKSKGEQDQGQRTHKRRHREPERVRL